MEDRYELCVIGAGTAGFAAAETARARGRSVLLVSGPGDLGGTCILRGCMPAKTLLSSTERLGDVEKADHLGVDVVAQQVDMRAIVARKRELVDYFAEDRKHELESYPLARGYAQFVARNAIEVDGHRVEGDAFVIASGSAIVAPKIPGLGPGSYFTSDEALEMTRAPKSLAVIGGGPVGCEFAQYFSRLGSRVTLLQNEATLLRNEDPDVGRAIAKALAADNVDVRTGTEVVSSAGREGARTLTCRDAGGTYDLRVETIMLASHRVPNVASLRLERAGVAYDEGGVRVDAALRTTNDRVFAAGDVLGRRCLVHVAEYAGKLAARNALEGSTIPADFERFEAHAIYTQPQVAVAGLTERACRERGIAIDIRRHRFEDIGKALVSDEAAGFVKMIVDADSRIRGVAIVGDAAIDLIGEAIAFIDYGATAADVTRMPHLHPTMGEIFVRVAEDFACEPQPALLPAAPSGAGALQL